MIAAHTSAAPIPSAVQTAEFSSSADHTAVTPVSYTAGASGHQLKWLPYRPAKSADAPATRPTTPVAKQSAVRMTTMLQAVESGPAAGNPLSDPFGDGGGPATPPALLNAKAVQTAQPTPSPSDLLPLEPPRALAAPPAAPAQPGAAAQTQPQAAAQPQTAAQPQPTPQPGAAEPPVDVPTLEEELARAPSATLQPCPSPKDLRKISEIDYKIAPEPGEFPRECPLGDERFVARSWPGVVFTWKASALCHKPLYFEEVDAERYGHSWPPGVQPFISAGHFFLTIPVLPYMMGVYPPTECIYTLGYYRPGDCAPYMIDPIPLSVRAALIQGGVVTGLAFLIP